MLVDKIQILCRKKGITISQLEKELSFGNGTIRRWNINSPSIDRVLEVANYFRIPINSLFDN
ncbi:MAG: helix-turn-helix transcriptional regulator [Peptostreptococcales bacterium]